MDSKLCTTCKEIKPLSEFGITRNKPRHQCKSCKNKESRQWYEKNKERKKHLSVLYRKTKKDQDLKKSYGISLHEYNSMLASQDNKCKICSAEQEELKRALCVDHDHDTGKVRGLLCDNCNRSLGLLKDNIEVLKRAVEYLENTK